MKPDSMKPDSGKFKFLATVYFEIAPDEAAALLMENDGLCSVCNWLADHKPMKEDMDSCSASSLKEALGKHLAERKIDERRQLTLQA